jgi:hypothetical protein
VIPKIETEGLPAGRSTPTTAMFDACGTDTPTHVLEQEREKPEWKPLTTAFEDATGTREGINCEVHGLGQRNEAPEVVRHAPGARD